MNPPIARRADAAMLVASALCPACLAASQVANVADAAHDGGVARVLGLGASPLRALDVAAGALFAFVPIGTGAERAALGGAIVAAAAGATLYSLTRRLLGACAETPQLGFAVAAIGAIAPLVGAPWQVETAAVGGSVVGGLLVLLALALTARAAAGNPPGAWPAATAALGLALGYEPLAGASALFGCAALVGVTAAGRAAVRDAWRRHAGAAGAGLLAGLAPLFIAVAHARSLGWAGESGAASFKGADVGRFVHDEVGPILGLLAAGGTGLALLVPGARALTAGLLAVAASGAAAAWMGAPLGPTRYGGAVLAAVAATFALAAVAMQAIARAVAAAPLPYARASAAMVVVLEVVWPVDAADDALVRTRARNPAPASVWDDTAWGQLPPKTVVLVNDPAIAARAAAARAQGELRGDLVFLDTRLGVDTRRAFEWSVLAHDVAFVPLWRDLALAGAPTEASLSSLARVRPVAMAYEPSWGYAIGRHLVPVALLDRFEPEPRGSTDRRRALDAFTARRERLAAIIQGDPELAAASADLLHARALVIGAGGDRDLTDRTLADWRAFAR